MADSEELGLQNILKRTEASARNAKAEYDAAVAAHQARENEALVAKAKLGTVKRWKPTAVKDDLDVIESEFAVRMSETRLKIAADLVMTIREKMIALERARDHARIGLQAYTLNPAAARSVKDQVERRLSSDEERRAAAERRRQQLNEIAAEKSRKLGGGSHFYSPPGNMKENEAPKSPFSDHIDRLKTEAARARIRREREAREPQRAREAQQKQQKQARQNNAKPPKEASTRPSTPSQPSSNPMKQIYTDWHTAATASLSSYSTLKVFPSPPYSAITCTKPACLASRSARSLVMCACDIEKAFRALELPTMKDERLRWHPDRFSKCAEGVRELMRKKAEEVFVVVDRLWTEEREGKGRKVD